MGGAVTMSGVKYICTHPVCFIGRVKTVPTGEGVDRVCPVCGRVYREKQDGGAGFKPPTRRTPEEIQKFLDGMRGIKR